MINGAGWSSKAGAQESIHTNVDKAPWYLTLCLPSYFLLYTFDHDFLPKKV
jgi:hypothetical protein